MPGFELFDQKEIDALADVIKRKVVHRYSFQDVREGIYRVAEFEEAFAKRVGTKYALGVSNGSAALYVGLKALGIGPGDEIITSAFTFIASIEAILECGAIPVLADVDESLNLDPSSVESLITDQTKAIMPVHMFGAAADMDAFKEICDLHGLYLIEDACQAIGATYKGRGCGGLGVWGAYSLDPYKVITVGEGGMLFTNDEELYKKMEYYHDHGHIHDLNIDRGAEGKACLGFNFRMGELQGALGLAQLSKLDTVIEAQRINKKKILDAIGEIEGISLRDLPDREGEIASHLILILPDANAALRFKEACTEAGAGCSILSDNTWHYAKHWATLREGKYYSRVRCPFDCPYAEDMPLYRPIEWTQTEEILSRSVMFAIGVVMDDAKIEKIANAINVGIKAAL